MTPQRRILHRQQWARWSLKELLDLLVYLAAIDIEKEEELKFLKEVILEWYGE